MAARVRVGEIVGVHGVRGLVRLKSFTADPAAVAAYGPVEDEAGRRKFVLRLQSAAKGLWVARVEGIETREAAETLKGVGLYIDRGLLPEPEEGEFYHTDLIGLRAERAGDGGSLGVVLAVHDFGAGTMLELALPDGQTEMVPFSLAVVPVVDLAGGRLVVEPPDEVVVAPSPDFLRQPPEAGGL
ncbi:MAG: ribosome maturation factor RimM [Rhodospirillaceae bacterium]